MVDGGYLNQVYNAGDIRGEGMITYCGWSTTTNQTISPEEPQIDENLVSCYYLAQDLVNENELGIPIEVSAMEQQESYVGFDFENIWVMKEQGGRRLPYLKNLSE